jgi:serine/threonine-protein kinase
MDPDSQAFRLGDSLEVGEKLGEGGMGAVYRAYHRRLDREVVIKVVSERLSQDEASLERFQREARALARLDHPGIVRVHDFALHEDRPYLVMEFVPGEDLSSRVPMSPAEFLPVLREIGAALQYAHEKGMVHRDVKPANVILADDGRVKLADFGLARLVGPEGHGWTLTAPEMVVGTPHFMAPEALRGKEPDPRMDVYSLGALAYQVVTGELPAGTLVTLPGGLDAPVKTAMAQDPGSRYGSVEEFLAALPEEVDPEVGAAPSPAPVTVLSDPAGATRAAASDPAAPAASPSTTGPLVDGVPSAEDRFALRAVALVLVVATALLGWAAMLSLTPRVMDRADVMPLLMESVEELADGRVVSRVRFELMPILAAVVGGTVGLACAGGLFFWWRRRGLVGGGPDEAVSPDRRVLHAGMACLALYLFRLALQAMGHSWIAVVIPIFGGAFEFVALYLFWLTTLEAWRRGWPPGAALRFGGMAVAAIPPMHNFFQFLRDWKPPV